MLCLLKCKSDLQASLALLGVDIEECKFGDSVLQAEGCPSCQNLGYRAVVLGFLNS